MAKIMSKQSYYEKLQHPLWQKRRLEIMSKCGFECQDCGNKDNQLNVHHLYYISKRNPWQYPDWALKCLCKDCHKEEHEKHNEPNDEFIETTFEAMVSFLEGDSSDYFYTWDLCVQFGMLRKNNPQLLNEFTGAVTNFAYQKRLELEAQVL